MRKLTILSIWGLAVLLFACTKKNEVVTTKTYLQTDVDGVTIKGDISSKNFKVFDGDVDSVAIISNIANHTGLTLEMHIKYSGKGTYIVWGTQALYTTLSAKGDIVSQYIAKPTNSNKITITDVDQSTKIATGKFNFALQKNLVPGGAPDSIVFTNGSFAVKLP